MLEREKTPVAFRNACDDLIFTEVLRRLEEEEKVNWAVDAVEVQPQTKQELCGNSKLIRLIRDAVSEYADDNGWAELGPCGGLIKRQQPDFDPRSYGYEKLSSLIERPIYSSLTEGNHLII